jgi:hypothetical protein
LVAIRQKQTGFGFPLKGSGWLATSRLKAAYLSRAWRLHFQSKDGSRRPLSNYHPSREPPSFQRSARLSCATGFDPVAIFAADYHYWRRGCRNWQRDFLSGLCCSPGSHFDRHDPHFAPD